MDNGHIGLCRSQPYVCRSTHCQSYTFASPSPPEEGFQGMEAGCGCAGAPRTFLGGAALAGAGERLCYSVSGRTGRERPAVELMENPRGGSGLPQSHSATGYSLSGECLTMSWRRGALIFLRRDVLFCFCFGSGRSSRKAIGFFSGMACESK